METSIPDVAQFLIFESIKDAILVGHGFAGSIVSALAIDHGDDDRSWQWIGDMGGVEQEAALERGPLNCMCVITAASGRPARGVFDSERVSGITRLTRSRTLNEVMFSHAKANA